MVNDGLEVTAHHTWNSWNYFSHEVTSLQGYFHPQDICIYGWTHKWRKTDWRLEDICFKCVQRVGYS